MTVRVACTELQPLLSHNGKSGIYLEPRTDDGRSPDESFRVIWLPQHDRHGLQATVQTSQQWCCLARNGVKHGLRTTESFAETLHNQFRPSTPWIDSTALQSYTVGPFPAGSTRAAILKICKAWDWNAKPIQPRARSADGRGVLWQLLAANMPSSEVYQLAHGDVLITPDPPRKNAGAITSADVQASAKTLAVLATTSPADSAEDPWAQYDPWSTPAKKSRTVPSNTVTKTDLEAMEQRMHQKIRETIKPESEDSSMGMDDERVAHLEQRMTQLEVSLQQQQHNAQSQHAEVQHQLHQVRSQVEQQGTTFHALLDQ